MSAMDYNRIQMSLIKRFARLYDFLSEINASIIWTDTFAFWFSDNFRCLIDKPGCEKSLEEAMDRYYEQLAIWESYNQY